MRKSLKIGLSIIMELGFMLVFDSWCEETQAPMACSWLMRVAQELRVFSILRTAAFVHKLCRRCHL